MGEYGGYGGGTGSRAAGHSDAGASLPHSHADVAVGSDFGKLNVATLGEESGKLECWPHGGEVECLNAFGEDNEVGVAH